MEERVRSDVKDGVRWWCKDCKTSKTIRAGSFFEKSKITLRQWMLLINFWAYEIPACTAGENFEVSKETAINVYQWLREVCSTKLLSTAIVLGGPGVGVQIDESLFRHKPKVRVMNLVKLHRSTKFNSITEDEPLPMKSGCLVWWTRLPRQPRDTWS